MTDGTTDDAVVEPITECHERLAAALGASLSKRAATDDRFRSAIASWADALGVDTDEPDRGAQAERVADQLVFRLLVGRLLEAMVPEPAAGAADERSSIELDSDVTISTEATAVVFEHETIASEIRLAGIADRLDAVSTTLNATELEGVKTDIVGRFYEHVVPEARRSDLGEFYTPPAICDLVSRLVIREPGDTVLDPACGVGGFLAAANERKRTLCSTGHGNYDGLRDQLRGVDVNALPAALASTTLALHDGTPDADGPTVTVSDFFDIGPGADGVGRDFDAIVGNPPYVRGRSLALDYKDVVREHLPDVDAAWLTRKMDLYGYFLTHATQFLREGGRLGFVLSDRWLDTRYGTDLQRFVLDNYVIEAVITFSQQAFEDALVGATVVLLEEERDATVREDNTARFVEVRDELGVDEIASLVEQDVDPDTLVVTDDYRLLATRQQGLGNLAKWNALFDAPPIYFDVRAKQTVALRERANLHTGLESGSNDFFYRQREAIDTLGLDDHCSPLLRASGQIDAIHFGDDQASEWGVFDVSGLVDDALEQTAENDDGTVERVKRWLAANEHDDVLEYVEQGEADGHHQASRRCKRRDVWFAIGDLDHYRPSLAIPLFCWRQNRVVWNEAGGVTDRQFHTVDPEDGVDEAVLCGILNSRLVWLAREIEGRHAAGQGMTRSQLVKYEAGGLPIPDPMAMTVAERDRIVAALEELLDRQQTLLDDGVVDPAAQLAQTDAERDALDRAVLATIGMEDRAEELAASVAALVDRREARAGERTGVLVDRTTEKAVVDLDSPTRAGDNP